MRLSLLLFAALLAGAAAAAPPVVPEPLVFKSPTATFGSRFAFALDEAGRIWTRAVAGGDWVLLGGMGLPFGEEAPAPDLRIVELYADSTGLIALGQDGRVYDAEIDDAVAGRIVWNFRWGNPWRIGAVPLFLPKGDFVAKTYCLLNHEGYFQEDIDGNPHTTERIDTFWLLDEGGRRLRYNDPWLPENEFVIAIASPKLGEVPLVALSASASTVFGADAAGNLYTRTIDFDTMGGNPGIAYSWARQHYGFAPEGFWAVMRGRLPFLLDIRSLPAEPWRQQPKIPGEARARLTIVQTGKGNAARELRVEGRAQDGRTGYWMKPIEDETWSFVATGQALVGAAFADAVPPAASFGERFEGQARFDAPGERRVQHRARLEGFNTLHEPSELTVTTDEGEHLRFTLHTRPDPWPPSPGKKARYLGAVVVDEASLKSPALRELFRTYVGGMKGSEVFVHVSGERIRIETVSHARADRVYFRFDFPRR